MKIHNSTTETSAQYGALEDVPEAPAKAKKTSPQKSSKLKPASPEPAEPAAQQASKRQSVGGSAPFDSPASADVEAAANARGKSGRGASARKSVRVSVAGSAGLPAEAVAAADTGDGAEVRLPSGRELITENVSV